MGRPLVIPRGDYILTDAKLSARVRRLLAIEPVDTDDLIENLRHMLPDDADIPAATLRSMFVR